MEEEVHGGFKYNLSELAGALGDFGTILPLMFAVALVCNLNLGIILLFFGIWFIVTGIYYRLPIPIEPMKVIAVVAISSVLAGPELAAAGILLGLLFFFLGFGKWMYYIGKYIPNAVIRGIQLGLALLLLKSAGDFMLQAPIFFIFGIAVIALVFLLSYFGKIPDLSALILLVLAVTIGIFLYGVPEIYLIKFPGLVIPSFADYINSIPELVLPQAVITITNAILATSLLTKDLFSREIPPERLSKTIGVMNIISAPLGGFPMCHGAGGLAAQYRFGARTGGSNIFAGVILLVIAAFFASPAIQELISPGIYGALLVFVAIEMGKHGLKTDSLPVTVVTGVLALLSVIGGFVAGMVLAYLMQWNRGRKQKGKDITPPEVLREKPSA
ncbi:MAG: putative sulfate/molybdate transporter [Methanoregulaceae archaeon]|nr:putative sulfate/molybdate transporter [Methanoregulaceae archaeon]